MNDTHVLYRMFDRDDVLLYVGITNNPKTRFRSHAISQDWWGQVANITVKTFPTRGQLVAAETKAIHEENPIHNKLIPVVSAPVPRLPRIVAPAPVCPSCDSPKPNLYPTTEWDWDLVSPNGERIGFCSDLFHFSGEDLKNFLVQRGLLQLSAYAHARLARHHEAFDVLAKIFTPDVLERGEVAS